MKTLTQIQYNKILAVTEKVANEKVSDIELDKDIYTTSEEIELDMLDYSDLDMFVEFTATFGWDSDYESIEVVKVEIERVFAYNDDNEQEDLKVA